jgi:8-oxo-dGTP pyrophosphatase MutT (NUDIX family)
LPSPDEFLLKRLSREWLADRLGRQPVLAPDAGFPLYAHPPGKVPVPAAVLVPVVNHAGGPTLMFTQRTAHLHDHAGQISFPGGRVDDGDADRIATALREAEEETGLPHARVQVIGRLPDFDIQTGFRVTPVVGWVEPPFDLKPDPFEVADVFEVPLEFFLDPANHKRHRDEINGRIRHYYSMPWGSRNIWGATAGMLYSLYRILSDETRP